MNFPLARDSQATRMTPHPLSVSAAFGGSRLKGDPLTILDITGHTHFTYAQQSEAELTITLYSRQMLNTYMCRTKKFYATDNANINLDSTDN